MRKTLILLVAMAFAATSASAQLSVLKNGQARFGKKPSNLVAVGAASENGTARSTIIQPPVSIDQGDTLACAIFYGRYYDNQSYIGFGTGKKVYIGALPYYGNPTTTNPNYSLVMNGYDGIKATCRLGTVFSFMSNATTMSNFVFRTNVSAPSFITSSDSRLKSNIEELGNTSGLLSRLNPVSYNLNVRNNAGDGEIPKDAAINSGNFDDRIHYGFIAQEVKEIFPNLVVEDEDGMLGIDYTGFIPVMVDAIKELQATVAEQQAEIARLHDTPKKKTASASEEGFESEVVSSYLAQNRPNPFRDSTEIRCALPDNVSEAYICIYDMQGKQLRRIPVTERGETTVTIEGNSLQPGMYIYALIADGSEIGSKRMIITD